MKIYTIKYDTYTAFDVYVGHVIAANSKKEAIEIAKKQPGGDEDESVWDSAKIEEHGIYTGNNPCPFILLSSFQNG